MVSWTVEGSLRVTVARSIHGSWAIMAPAPSRSRAKMFLPTSIPPARAICSARALVRALDEHGADGEAGAGQDVPAGAPGDGDRCRQHDHDPGDELEHPGDPLPAASRASAAAGAPSSPSARAATVPRPTPGRRGASTIAPRFLPKRRRFSGGRSLMWLLPKPPRVGWGARCPWRFEAALELANARR